jgi:hypothetical protein
MWYWDDSAKRYRDPVTGRFVGVDQMQVLREVFIDQQKGLLESLVWQFDEGKITYEAFRDIAKQIIKDTYIDLYAMGAGGRNNLTPRDWGRIGAMLKEQYKYLRNMMGQILRGEISPRQAISRFGMYINSANEALWKALTRDYPFTLPAYPGDGSTECLVNCKCEWHIVKVEGGYDCYWVIDTEAENCEDCQIRAKEWNPWKWREVIET